MKNSAQIKKKIKGKKDDAGFPLGEICGYNEKYAIEFMIEKLNLLPDNCEQFTCPDCGGRLIYVA